MSLFRGSLFTHIRALTGATTPTKAGLGTTAIKHWFYAPQNLQNLVQRPLLLDVMSRTVFIWMSLLMVTYERIASRHVTFNGWCACHFSTLDPMHYWYNIQWMFSQILLHRSLYYLKKYSFIYKCIKILYFSTDR